MNIRDLKAIPREVETFLQKYETKLKLREDNEIELIVITYSDVFEGVIQYWDGDGYITQFVTWNSWYDDEPTLYELKFIP